MNYNELSNALKKINTWYGKKVKVLSIKTRPFNTHEIFTNIINKVLNNNGNVLYVLCCSEGEDFYNKKKEISKSIFKENKGTILGGNLTFVNIDNIKNASNDYDLVLFDDISLFSTKTNEDIREAVEEVYWRSNKIIVYTCEVIFPIGEKMNLLYLRSKEPMIEPRLLTTRIKLEEDIPLALFEYFKWFKDNKRVTLIVVPSEEKLNKVYNSYYHILKNLDIRVVKYNKNDNFKFVDNVISENSESIFIVTNCVGDYMNKIIDVNIVALFADDFYYSYKKIIYMCASINNKVNILSELIMVSKEISEDMDNAKSIARGFNQRLWEKRYLSH